jgi:hypothetical protein
MISVIIPLFYLVLIPISDLQATNITPSVTQYDSIN